MSHDPSQHGLQHGLVKVTDPSTVVEKFLTRNGLDEMDLDDGWFGEGCLGLIDGVLPRPLVLHLMGKGHDKNGAAPGVLTVVVPLNNEDRSVRVNGALQRIGIGEGQQSVRDSIDLPGKHALRLDHLSERVTHAAFAALNEFAVGRPAKLSEFVEEFKILTCTFFAITDIPNYRIRCPSEEGR